VARNRQRAKQRQQQRREERLRERGTPGDGDGRKADPDDPAEVGRVAGETGAPPENVGHSDATLEADASARRELSQEEEDELFLDEEDFEVDQEELAEAEQAEESYAPKGRRGDGAAASGAPVQATGLARVVAFLRACWAELQRVQWPDRKQTTQLTAIVLVFIIIMGGYLGLLDAIVSRVVQEII
jgi:preprotein translocase SecE subunit